MSSVYSLTLLDFWLSMDISLWECDAGLFDWILNGNSYECGLQTYSFDNDIYKLHYSSADIKGDFIPNTCALPKPENGTTPDNSTAPIDPAEETEPVALNDLGWF
jgi:hypothetical protein